MKKRGKRIGSWEQALQPQTLSLNDKCKRCGKMRGQHKSTTLHCPVGLKTRVGYVQFSQVDIYC